MTGKASHVSTFHTPLRILFVLALLFAKSISFNGIAHAEQPSGSRAACDASKKQTCENLVQDNILWRIGDPESPGAKHWAQDNLDSLCGCTNDPYETVNCFQIQVNNNRKTWQEAIAICRAK